MRVLRIYHAGRDPSHRLREHALLAAGVEVTLLVPSSWPEGGAEQHLSPEPFPVLELPVLRPSDVNRHRYASTHDLAAVIDRVRPDLVDLHEEPFSLAVRQGLAVAGDLPCVAYAAQNVDKRFPPPFAQFEKAALRRLSGLYPCSRQAASVARGKGFTGLIEVLPLGRDAASFTPGSQSTRDPEVVLGLVGRLVPEKGIADAVHVLERVRRQRPARLRVIGQGPEEQTGRRLAAALGVEDAVSWEPWRPGADMASAYRDMHVALLPSRATETWTEQFGRVIVEAQASGAVVAGYASGAIPEVLGAAGLVAPEGAVDDLAARVVDVLQDEDDFQRRRAAGLRQVEDMTWEQVGLRQRAFYERVLGGCAPVVAGRSVALREFGPPAVLRGGTSRPFALPILRKDNPVTRGLGSLLDVTHRS